MASSKSFRASMLPSAFSFSSSSSHHHHSSSADADDRQNSSRPRYRPTSSHEQGHHHPHAEPQISNSPPRSRHADAGEPVPPKPLVRKSKTWSDRLNSLIPSLTHSSSEQNILRKPVGGSVKSSPAEPPPPPPYDLHDPSGPTSADMRKSVLPDSRPWRPEMPTRPSPRPESASSGQYLQTHIPNFSMSEPEQPQIMPPIPPSPEAKRATLTKQQPAAQAGTQRSNPMAEPTSKDVPKTSKLVKENQDSRSRRNSLQQPKNATQSPNMLPRQVSPSPDLRGRSISAQHPMAERTSNSNSRVASTPIGARPPSHDGSQSPTRGRLRRSWLPGGNRSRSNSMDVSSDIKSAAWVMSDGSQAEYNATLLTNAEKVPELWNESGDVLVYLYPKSSGCGPSFKVQQYTISSSFKFMEWTRAEQESPATTRSRARSFDGRGSLSVADATRLRSPPTSPPLPEPNDGELRLYLPPSSPQPAGSGSSELDRLISIRNLFAFLTGQPLVGTKANNTVFKAFIQIAKLLQEFDFAGGEGNSFGPAVDLSFGFYIDQLGLADCRHSREKTVEALVLGERMRSTSLYNEAFTHAAGKHSAIMELQLPLYDLVSEHTHNDLERAKLEIGTRQHNVNEHLEQFDFPSMFAGIASSTSISELRQVRFKVWRNSFNRMRQFVLGHYKSTFGNWPPKASSKKNPFAESGLNRLVLKVLYSDMCALYDLLVDRTRLTSRIIDVPPTLSEEADKMTMSALQAMLSESDRSKPPVLPPIPFDLPQLPSMAAILPNYNSLSAKDQSKHEKIRKENELLLILNKAYNFDTSCVKLPFLEEFKAFECREGKGKTAPDLADQRIGYWLFMYVVIQSLPMLVVDAPGLRFTDGTEYFLSRPPMGNPPWFEDRGVRREWYEIAGSGVHVQLSAQTVMFGIEATYHRSHCWLAAKRWEGEEGAEALPPAEPAMSPLAPPRPIFQGVDPLIPNTPPAVGQGTPSPPLGGPQMALRPRNLSPASPRASPGARSSIVLGLAPVGMEQPSPFGGHLRSSSMGPPALQGGLGSRSVSAGNLAALNSRDSRPSPPQPVVNSGKTFDDILGGGTDKKDAGKKKSRFF